MKYTYMSDIDNSNNINNQANFNSIGAAIGGSLLGAGLGLANSKKDDSLAKKSLNTLLGAGTGAGIGYGGYKLIQSNKKASDIARDLLTGEDERDIASGTALGSAILGGITGIAGETAALANKGFRKALGLVDKEDLGKKVREITEDTVDHINYLRKEVDDKDERLNNALEGTINTKQYFMAAYVQKSVEKLQKAIDSLADSKLNAESGQAASYFKDLLNKAINNNADNIKVLDQNVKNITKAFEDHLHKIRVPSPEDLQLNASKYMVNIANFNSIGAGINGSIGAGVGSLTGTNNDDKLKKGLIATGVGVTGVYGIGQGLRLAKEQGKLLDNEIADKFYQKSGENLKELSKALNRKTPIEHIGSVMTKVGAIPALAWNAVRSDPTKHPGYPGVVYTGLHEGLNHIGNVVNTVLGHIHHFNKGGYGTNTSYMIEFSNSNSNSANNYKTNYNEYINNDPYYSTLDEV